MKNHSYLKAALVVTLSLLIQMQAHCFQQNQDTVVAPDNTNLFIMEQPANQGPFFDLNNDIEPIEADDADFFDQYPNFLNNAKKLAIALTLIAVCAEIRPYCIEQIPAIKNAILTSSMIEQLLKIGIIDGCVQTTKDVTQAILPTSLYNTIQNDSFIQQLYYKTRTGEAKKIIKSLIAYAKICTHSFLTQQTTNQELTNKISYYNSLYTTIDTAAGLTFGSSGLAIFAHLIHEIIIHGI